MLLGIHTLACVLTIIIMITVQTSILSVIYKLMPIINMIISSWIHKLSAFMSSSDRVFHSLIADGKNEYF